tara:strand:+ start:1733 stop:2875 length:1143 start_codon:yes stop_codon:yes gene_type:complete
MSFFNPKEDVLDIQLTQHGKRLLAKGKLRPKYYAFYDDDILYDQRHTDSTLEEKQNDIKQRILDETPRLKTQYEFLGIQSNFQRNTQENQRFDRLDYEVEGTIHKILTLDNHSSEYVEQNNYGLYSPLGVRSINNKEDNQKQPRFTLEFLEGTLSGSTQYMTASNRPTIKTPQIETDITVNTMKIYPHTTKKYFNNFFGDIKIWHPDIEWDEYILALTDTAFENEDESYIFVDPQYLVIDVGESQVDISNEFEIEIFEIEQRNGDEFLKQLKFLTAPSPIKDGLLLSVKEYDELYSKDFAAMEEKSVDAGVVDNYFNIVVDEEIDSEYLKFITGQLTDQTYYGNNGSNRFDEDSSRGTARPDPNVYKNIDGKAEFDLEDC